MSHDYIQARINLSAFVKEKAKDTAKDIGFTWTASENAPDNYQALREAYEYSVKTGEPMPISSLHCDDVIYVHPSINMAMRFWHDVHHAKLDLSFDLDDELELGLWHISQLRESGFAPDSMEHRMMKVDLLGQNYLIGVAQRFPINQRDFVLRCLELGIDEGVLAEARLQN